MAEHKHNSPLRGTRVIPHPHEGDSSYTAVNFQYAGQQGHVHEIVVAGGRELAKVGFPDKRVVYYLLEDLELLPRD
ncbi:hypothetical protein EPN44_00475 [bacterium]|nr:MAG: hypothetical protein EPN44_00475 [bacterium]